MKATDDQAELIAVLPPFAGTEVAVEGVKAGSGGQLYRIRSGSSTAGAKVFDGSGTGPRTPQDRAGAEAAGLTWFSPLDIAPALLWQGELGSREPVVVYKWPDGLPGDDRSVAGRVAPMMAGALRAIHASEIELKMIAPHPRNLERWWEHTHEQYRELPGELVDSLPESLRDTLARLVNTVGADAQAHKRFWGGAALAPIHGTAILRNLWVDSARAVLVDWQQFGLGDPALEVGYACCLLSQELGTDAADRFAQDYLQPEQDEMFARRVTLYRRLWPFGHVLALLGDVWAIARLEPLAGIADARPLVHAAATLSYFTEECMRTYEWHPSEIEQTNQDLQEWMADLELAMEQNVGRLRP